MKHIKTLIITLILPFMLLSMTGCSKEGDMSEIKVNDNKTTVYTVNSLQNDIYAGGVMNNLMIGKHKYTFETASDGKTITKYIWEWKVDPDIIRTTLERIQPNYVTEESMNNCYAYLDNMMHYDALAWSINYGEDKKAPSYIDVLYSKSKSKNKTTLQVMVDLTDENLDLSKENVQYEELSNYIWPRLYNKKTHTYEVSKSRIKKAINSKANEKYIEQQLPILSKGYKVDESFANSNDLKSKQFENVVQQAKDAKKKASK